MSKAKNGCIFDCHDGGDGDCNGYATIAALEKAIPQLKQRGFNFVTIASLLDNFVSPDAKFIPYSTPLRLNDDYELSLKYFDDSQRICYLELTKNGAVVDSKVLAEGDTYSYNVPIDGFSVEKISIHIKEVGRIDDKCPYLIVDGIQQVLEKRNLVYVFGKQTAFGQDLIVRVNKLGELKYRVR